MLNELFDGYLAEFKRLSTIDKREEILNNLKEFIAIFDALAQREGLEVNYIKSNEINNLYGDDVSEDDFLEGVFVYFEVAKNVLGQYLSNHDNK